MTQVGHVAYQSMRRGETNTMSMRPCVYLFSIVSYQQNLLVAWCEPQMTFMEATYQNLRLISNGAI